MQSINDLNWSVIGTGVECYDRDFLSIPVSLDERIHSIFETFSQGTQYAIEVTDNGNQSGSPTECRRKDFTMKSEERGTKNRQGVPSRPPVGCS